MLIEIFCYHIFFRKLMSPFSVWYNIVPQNRFLDRFVTRKKGLMKSGCETFLDVSFRCLYSHFKFKVKQDVLIIIVNQAIVSFAHTSNASNNHTESSKRLKTWILHNIIYSIPTRPTSAHIDTKYTYMFHSI